MSLARRPSLPPMPDLAHLTEEERSLIESVIQRQKEEEEREQEMLRSLKDELHTYQASVKKLSEESKVATTGQQGAICQICHKTKFADGIGHKCHYCGVRSCARCGGKMGLKSNKPGPTLPKDISTIWACNLCKKSKELLIKTGQWYHGGMAKPVSLEVYDTGSETSSIKTDTSPPHEKKPRFPDNHQVQLSDGGHSSEKENIIQNTAQTGQHTQPGGWPEGRQLNRSGSLLRRQYSLSERQEQAEEDCHWQGDRSRHPAATECPEQETQCSDMNFSQTDRLKDSAANMHQFNNQQTEQFNRDHYVEDHRHGDRTRHGEKSVNERSSQDIGVYEIRKRNTSAERTYTSGDQAGSNLAEERPRERTPSRERSSNREESRRNRDDSRHREAREPLDRRKDDTRGEDSGRHDLTDRRPRHSETRGRERDLRDSDLREHDRSYNSKRVSPERPLDRDPRHREDERTFNPEHATVLDSQSRMPDRHPERLMRVHGQPSNKDLNNYDKYPTKIPASSMGHRGDRRDRDEYVDDQFNRQHLDPSSAVAKSRTNRKKLEKMLRNDSLSSDPSDCVRPPPPKPHKHKKGKKQRQASLSSSDDEIQTTPECTSCDEPEIESESVSEKEPMFQNRDRGFHVYDREENWRKDEILAAKIKKFLTHPVTWQPSADGTKLEGHMILRKSVEGHYGDRGSILGKGTLGLKVTGGKLTESGYRGAFITKVKKGSIADTVGHLRAGDEVVEWNGRNLRDRTLEEVYDIIFESKQEPQVELIVQRPISSGEFPPGIPEHPDLETEYAQQPPGAIGRLKRPSVTITSPGSPGTTRPRPHSPQMCGKITPMTYGKLQVRLFYDAPAHQLLVTIVAAADLPPRDNGQLRNPYCKLYLLPERSEKSKRRTKTIAGTFEPKWEQIFMYAPMKRQELKKHSLEITVYDYDRIGSGEYVGEVIIDLSSISTNDETQWHPIRHHDDTSSSVTSTSREGYRIGKDHLSPPSSVTTRLSDSDMSELDLEDNLSIATEGTSVDYSHGHHSRKISDVKIGGKEGISNRSHSPVSIGTHSSRSRSPARHHISTDGIMSPTERESYSSTNVQSPKKRLLPQIPHNTRDLKRDRVTQDLEDRARALKQKMNAYKQSGTGLPSSDTEATSRTRSRDRSKELHGMRSRPDRSYDRSRDIERNHLRRRAEFGSDIMSDDVHSDASETSEMSEISRISTISVRSTQSERPHRKLSEFASKMEQRAGVSYGSKTKPPLNRSLSNNDVGQEEKNDGSVSDSALNASVTEGRSRRRPSLGYKVAALVGLSRKSSSTSQLTNSAKPNHSVPLFTDGDTVKYLDS